MPSAAIVCAHELPGQSCRSHRLRERYEAVLSRNQMQRRNSGIASVTGWNVSTADHAIHG